MVINWFKNFLQIFFYKRQNNNNNIYKRQFSSLFAIRLLKSLFLFYIQDKTSLVFSTYPVNPVVKIINILMDELCLKNFPEISLIKC